MTPFIVKVKTVNQRDPKDPKKLIATPLVKFMKPDFPYAVLSIWNQSKKNEDGTYTIHTRFLIGDQDDGNLVWVDSHGVLFVGVVGPGMSKGE